jgi:PAS domain S-box-containing protein
MTQLLAIHLGLAAVTAIGTLLGVKWWLRRQMKLDHSFFKQIPDPALVSEYGVILNANRAAQRLFGFPNRSIIGMPVAGLLADPADEQKFVRALLSGPVTGYELRLKNARGEIRDCLVTAHGRFDPDGRIIGCRGLARDVTERKQAEAELLRAERDYRGLFEHAHDAIILLDPSDETVLDANEAACALYGFERDEFVGRSMIDLSVDPVRGRDLVIETCNAGGEYCSFESRQYRRDGTIMDVKIDSVIVSYQDRRVILSINRDVSAQRRVENERRELLRVLRDVAEQWTTTFDAVQVPIVLLDTRGNIQRLNRAAQSIAGKPFSELVHRPAAELSGEPWRTIARVGREAFEHGLAETRQAVEGDSVWQVSASRASNGSASRAIVVAYDLTLITRLEASVRRNEVAAALGALVAGVAHEVRNPLFTISATLDAWEAVYSGSEGLVRYAGALRDQVDRLNRLMHDLLEYGKPNPPNFQRHSIAGVIRAGAADCAVVAAQRSVSVVLAIDDGLPCVNIDAQRMEQVFQNVIDNAIRHSPRGGTVRVEATAGETGIVCRILDEGAGLAPEDLANVFVPMYTRRHGGTGLGLPIARNIVAAHRGEITLTNRDGARGAVATIHLPYAQQQIERDATEACA